MDKHITDDELLAKLKVANSLIKDYLDNMAMAEADEDESEDKEADHVEGN